MSEPMTKDEEAAVREAGRLVAPDSRTEHDSDTCSRLSCCDEAAESGEECDCGAQQTYRLAAAARAVLAETEGES